MKRSLCILLVAVLLFLSACTPLQDALISPANFYYCTSPVRYDSPEGIISAEIRETADHKDSFESLLDLYLKGPSDSQHTTPFPMGVSVVAYSQNGSTAELLLSRQFARLTGADLTVACACLTMTITELTQTSTLIIRAENASLDGKQQVTMRASDLIFWDDSAQPEDTDETR